MESSCVFCKIVQGTLASAIVDQSEHSLVVLDRNQAARGHLLVIPKRHALHWHELEPSVAADIAMMAHRWARVLVEAVNPDGYNLLMNNGVAAGQDVFHVHLHITPRTSGDSYYRFGGAHYVLTDGDADALKEHLRRVFTAQATAGDKELD